MDIKFLVILLIIGLVLGTYSISNYALAVSQGTGKLVPNEKISSPTSPPGFEKSGMARVISSTTSEQEISDIQQKGCSVIHRLNHATSFFCPSGVVKTLDNVRPVRIYQPHDLDADIQIQADRVWNELGFDGSGVKVAILDSGVQDDPHHAELYNSILLTADFTGEGGHDKDFSGHGTHVSGIVTANGVYNISGTNNLATGVAPGADIIVGKVCGSSGCPEDAIIAGIEWATFEGADVINLSLGGGLSFGENCDGVGDLTVAAVNVAVDLPNGIVVIISSGNGGSKNAVSYPGCASGAIAVAAVNSSDRIASFSNVGPAMDIVAPGVSILSTYSCNDDDLNLDCASTWYAYLSGTSMSSPHVAGVVALMLEKNPDLTVDQIKNALYSTAKKIGNGKFDGNGRVDAFGAVNFVSGPAGPDNESPVITPNPISDPFSQTETDQYIEICTVTDNDPDYNGNCYVSSGGINTTILGTQSVTYSADPDAAGNEPLNEVVSTTIVEPSLEDVVEITKAEYRMRNGDLRVQATSTDLTATLTVEGYGEMKNNGDGTYQFRAKGVTDPGDTITVTSSGGSATSPVKHR